MTPFADCKLDAGGNKSPLCREQIEHSMPKHSFMTLFPATRFVAFQSGIFFDTVCDGCETECIACEFDTGAHKNKSPVCSEQIKHSTSACGNHTVKDLSIDPGYWRATENSTDVRACYNAKACGGGVTGTSSFCQDGHGGPCESRLFHLGHGVLFHFFGIGNCLNKVLIPRPA